jgi:hypothetical protein
MASIGQILSRTFFWTYERGTWQYDLAVILILIFVLLTPPSWFHEQPQTGVAPYPGEVQRLATPGGSAGAQSYRVDARILAPPKQTPALENDLHHALQKALPDELGNGRFAITKIAPVRDESGTVIAYDVEVQR